MAAGKTRHPPPTVERRTAGNGGRCTGGISKKKKYIYNSVQTRAGDFFPSLSPQTEAQRVSPYDVPHSFRDGRGARVYRVFDDGLHVGRRLWRVSHARPSGFAYVRRNSGGPDDIAVVRYVVRYPPERSSRKSADVSARRQQPSGPVHAPRPFVVVTVPKPFRIRITRRDAA